MLFYANLMLFILVFWFLLSWIDIPLRNKIYGFMICFILFALMGFKGASIGSDTPAYINSFIEVGNSGSLFENSTRFESGYIVYSRIIAWIFNEYQYLFIITSLIVTICIWKFIINNSPMIWISFYLLVSLRLYYFFLSGLRQTIALAIICLSYSFIKKRKPVKFIILVLLATLFHNSAIVFLIAYPISKLKFNRKGVSITLLLTAFVYFAFDFVLSSILSLIPEYYSHYQYSVQFSANNLANYINALVILVFLFVGIWYRYSKSPKKAMINKISIRKNNDFNQKDTLLYFMLIAFAIAVIATSASLLDRIYLYFWIFVIIYIPDVIFNIKNRKSAVLITYLIIIFTFAYNLLLLYFRPEWNSIIPYEFFW